MTRSSRKALSSKQLLEKIGITDGELDPALMLDADDLDLDGDLGVLLSQRYHTLVDVQHDLQPGMLVTWKAGLKNKRLPRSGVPAVVVERLETPLYDGDEPGSTYYHEPLDVVLGVFLDTGPQRGDLLLFHYDSRRFEPWVKQEG